MRPIGLPAAKSLAEQKLASYWLEIQVNEGANTKDEKAAHLAAMFKRMGAKCCGVKYQAVASGRCTFAAPNMSSKACRSAMSTSARVTGWPRSTSDVTP